MTSLRPYLLRAFYEWIVDNGSTPHILVDAEREDVTVPRQYAQDGRIVLNIHPDAVANLILGNEEVTFQARFGGVPMRIHIPVTAVLAIYARETGRGMVFDEEMGGETPPPSPSGRGNKGGDKPKSKRPSLRVVK